MRRGDTLFAGEAAGLQDALWGFGMRYALVSGHMAASAMLASDPHQYARSLSRRFAGFLRTAIVNRYFYERMGDGGYARLLRHIAGAADAREWLRRFYAPRLWKTLLFPVARARVRGRPPPRRGRGPPARGVSEPLRRMPLTPHVEHHFTASATVRDVVIGMADGLTVPFALAAGLTGAIAHTNIIVTAGLAEIAAGSIAMGLGGYLAGRSDAEHYVSERDREHREVREKPAVEAKEVRDIFRAYGLSDEEIAPILVSFEKRPQQWIDFMMRFELGLEKPDPRRALQSALTIGGSYAVGGLIPLAPYILVDDAPAALKISVAVTLAALAVFGYVKGRFTGARPWKSALQTTLIGGVAASAAFAIARAVGG